jgi:hypothetical protein
MCVKDCLVSEGMARLGELNKTTTIPLATRGPICSLSLAYEEISIRCNQQSVRFSDGNYLKSVSWARIESVSSVKHCTFVERRVTIVKCKLLWEVITSGPDIHSGENLTYTVAYPDQSLPCLYTRDD